MWLEVLAEKFPSPFASPESGKSKIMLESPISRLENATIGPDLGLVGPELALAPEEIATLSSLMGRYDQILVDVDNLNEQIESLLKLESPPAS
jgi:hypothetical protein